MSSSTTYTIRYAEWVRRAGITVHDLPEHLQELIGIFLTAKEAWERADEATKNRLLPVLVQSDAVIAADIYRLYQPKPEPPIDKIKLMAMKAKALRLKLE